MPSYDDPTPDGCFIALLLSILLWLAIIAIAIAIRNHGGMP